MKKLIYLIFAASLLMVGCTRFAEDGPVSYDSVAAPQIMQMFPNGGEERSDADSSFYFKVVPAQGTNFYAYVVVKGPEQPLDPETVAALGYGSIAVKCNKVFWDSRAQEYIEQEVPIQDNINANVETGKDTVVFVDGLIQDAQYTIYAVATNNQGKVSDLAAKTIRTYDSWAPHILAEESGLVDGSDSIINVVFDEPVVLDIDGEVGMDGKIRAYYFAKNTIGFTESDEDNVYNILQPMVDVDVPGENISLGADGKSIDVALPGVIPGAYVSLQFAESVVKDREGHSSHAYDDYMMIDVWPVEYGTFPCWAEVEAEPMNNAVWCHLENRSFGLKAATLDRGLRSASYSASFSRPHIHLEPLNPRDTLEYLKPAEIIPIFVGDSMFQASAIAPEYNRGHGHRPMGLNGLVYAWSEDITATASSVWSGSYVTETKSYLVDPDSIRVRTSFDRGEILYSFGISVDNEQAAGEKYPFWSSLGWTIPEGAFEDLWGNQNEEFSTIGEDEEGQYFGNFVRISLDLPGIAVEGWWEYQGVAGQREGNPLGLRLHFAADEDVDENFCKILVDSVAVLLYTPDSTLISETPMFIGELERYYRGEIDKRTGDVTVGTNVEQTVFQKDTMDVSTTPMVDEGVYYVVLESRLVFEDLSAGPMHFSLIDPFAMFPACIGDKGAAQLKLYIKVLLLDDSMQLIDTEKMISERFSGRNENPIYKYIFSGDLVGSANDSGRLSGRDENMICRYVLSNLE